MNKRIFWIDNLRGFLILQTALLAFFLPKSLETRYSSIARHASCFDGHMSYVDAGIIVYITIMGLALPLKFNTESRQTGYGKDLWDAIRRTLMILLCAPLLGIISNIVQGQELQFYWRDRVFLNLAAAYFIGFVSLRLPQVARVFIVIAWIVFMSVANRYISEARLCELRYELAWTGFGVVSLFSVHIGELHRKLFPSHQIAFAVRLLIYGVTSLCLGGTLYSFFGIRFNGIIVTPPYMLCSFAIAVAYLLLFSTIGPLRQRALPCLTGLGQNSLLVFMGLFIFRGVTASLELHYVRTPVLGIPAILLCGYVLERWPHARQSAKKR